MKNRFHKNLNELDAEQNLILQAQLDIENFEPLYNQNFEKVFRFVYQRTEKPEEAADITSQVFLNAMTNINKYRYMGLPFSAWLFRIAINEINKHYKASKKQRQVNIELEKFDELIKEEDNEAKEDRINQILQFIRGLQGNELLMIEMRFFEDRPFKEIADILDITESNAKIRMYRLLDKIKLQIA